jgi:hypothetical protein
MGPVAATTEVVEDFDGRPIGGGGLSTDPVVATTKVVENIDGRPPRG